MYLQTIVSKNYFLLTSWISLKKIAGSGSGSIVIVMDSRIRIHAKLWWIRNTAFLEDTYMHSWALADLHAIGTSVLNELYFSIPVFQLSMCIPDWSLLGQSLSGMNFDVIITISVAGLEAILFLGGWDRVRTRSISVCMFLLRPISLSRILYPERLKAKVREIVFLYVFPIAHSDNWDWFPF